MATATDLGIKSPLTPDDATMPPILRQALAQVRQDHDLSDKRRKKYVDRWKTWYGLHRNYERFSDAAQTEPGRDIVEEAKREFGAELFIPYTYGLIETMTPRLLMNNPRLKIKPKAVTLTRDRAEAVRVLFAERQSEVDYALSLIPTARRGLKYGLGISKNFWETKTRAPIVLERGEGTSGDRWATLKARLTGQPQVTRRVDITEGPRNEDVEILDFFWDPAAKNIETCRFVIHRTWRDFAYIRQRVEQEQWLPIDLERVKGMGPQTDRASVFSDRAEAGGISGFEENLPDMHEVWEWHDGNTVVTVLDGELPVQYGDNQIAGELPFSIWRPTVQENEFVGIGEIEPIVDLQRELNTMRSSRLDNTMLITQKAFIYAEGLVDPADLIVSPGGGIPVEGGAIDDVIRPLQWGEIPSASYREESALKSDFEMATGLSETVAGSEGTGNASETATGIQFVQAAANVRIELKTKLLAHECVKRDTNQWLELYRDRTLNEPQEVIIEENGEFKLIEVTGDDLDLVRAVDPEEDSLAPENRPEKINNALALFNQLNGNPVVNPRAPVRYLLNAVEVPDAETWILPEVEQLNPQVAQVVGQALQATLASSGMDEQQAGELTLQAMQAAMQATGVSGGDQNAASQNGGAPAPSAPPSPEGASNG
jgi:hypothetical protein